MLSKALSLAAAGNAAPAGYQIERSLRFNSADSAYLSRTNGTSTDQKKFTLSFWMKRSTISTATGQWIFSAGSASGTDFLLGFNSSSDALQLANSSVSADGQTTTMLFRDTSAWYHVVVVGDSTQATNADRIKFYVNGVQQATSITGTITLNSNFRWNTNSLALNIGRYTVGGGNYANLYLAEIHNVDGQALTPSDFGETDATTGVWKPKEYTGTYGTNGFYLNFSDGSSVAALGTDFSGNGNDWTPTNFAVGTQVYSSQITGTVEESSVGNTGPAYNSLLFNGSSGAPYVRAYLNSTVTWTPSSPYTSVTDIALFTWYPAGNTALGTLFYVNGVLVTPTAKTQGGWTTLPIPAGGTVTSVGFGNNNAGDYVYVAQIRINNTVITEVTANADNLVDTPTPYGTDTGAGGEVRGNYATQNPLDTGGAITVSNGNLQVSAGATNWDTSRSTIGVTSGKWYWEAALTSGIYCVPGITTSNASITVGHPGTDAYGWGYASNTGNKVNNNSAVSYGATWISSDVIGIAFDADAGTLTFYKNNVSQGTAYTGLTSGPYFPSIGVYSSTAVVNFGQRPFSYTAPSGFKALCTQNLPDPTVVQGDDYFNTVLYTGTSSTGDQNVTGFGFDPDFVWIKARSGVARSHVLFDQVRGDTAGLYSNATAVEATWTNQAFITDGYKVSATYSSETNANGESFVMWGWNAGGSSVANTDGTIASTVRANPTAGFSIVSYTGVGSTGTVGHGLGSAPAMIIARPRPKTNNWLVYHQTQGAGNFLELNTTNTVQANTIPWNNTAPTSTVFSVNTPSGVWLNESGTTYIAYCFAEVEGYSKALSWTGNGSADGVFLYCGFRPAIVLIKRTSQVEDWVLVDNARSPYNLMTNYLLPSSSSAEGSTTLYDFVSNGIKMRGVSQNESGATYIGYAFAENPFKYSLAR